MDSVTLFATRITTLPQENILDIIKDHLTHRRKALFIASANPEILLRARNDKRYRDILNGADVVIPDGIGVILALRLLYGIKIKRVTGVDLAYGIIQMATRLQKSIFLLGGSIDANKEALQKLRVTNYELRVTSYELRIEGLGGNFTDEEAVKKINDFQPDILFIALGSPKQEIFIHKLLTKSYILNLKSCLLMPIGGAVDFWANPKLRAPKFLQRIGLEWLWRFMRQPWRIKRISNAVILFPIICLYDFLQQKRASQT